jgi:hypothetical protein
MFATGVPHGNPTAPLPSSTKRALLSLFLLFHLFVILVWSFPVYWRPLSRINAVIAPYMAWSGLSQGWALFAPDPTYVNVRLDAEITYRDGLKKIWKFPMPQDFGYYRRYFLERERKFSTDNLRLDSNSFLWPDAARHIAWINNDASNPPVKVALIRHWSFIPPLGSNQPVKWDQYTFFTYTVAPKDLQ